MLIIADKRIPAPALKTLSKYGEAVLIKTSGITYEAISGHPDIFFTLVNRHLVTAPNLPDNYINLLEGKGIRFVKGELPVGVKYPDTAGYNVVCTDKYLLHNFRYTDPVITKLSDNLDLIHINQGYARCNLIPLKEDHFITSDEGIYRVLKNYNLEVLLADPKGIVLPGFKHGFIGGTAGVHENEIFFIGKLAFYPDGKKIRDFLSSLNYSIIELYEGPLIDGGSLVFINKE